MRSWGTYIQNPHNDFLLRLEEEVTDQSLQYFTAVYSPSSFSLLILFFLCYEHDIFNERLFPPVYVSAQFLYLSITQRLLSFRHTGITCWNQSWFPFSRCTDWLGNQFECILNDCCVTVWRQLWEKSIKCPKTDVWQNKIKMLRGRQKQFVQLSSCILIYAKKSGPWITNINWNTLSQLMTHDHATWRWPINILS